MPSPIAHISVGYLVYRFFKRRFPPNLRRVFNISVVLVVVAGLSVLPDMDFLVGLVLGDIERYHNNVSHSLFAAGIVAFAVAGLAYWRYRSGFWAWFTISLIAYGLHPVLDLFSGERGVLLLWPLVDDRFTAPVRLFYGVQWGLGWISVWHLLTIFSELLFFVILFFLFSLYERKKALARDVVREENNA